MKVVLLVAPLICLMVLLSAPRKPESAGGDVVVASESNSIPPATPATPATPAPPKVADMKGAVGILVSIRGAQVMYSVKNGGKGHERFAHEFSSLTNALDGEILHALRFGNVATGHVNGYSFELHEPLSGDGFVRDFLVVAKPFQGFSGPSITIDKMRNMETNQIKQ